MELDRRAFLRSVGAAGVGGVSLPVLADGAAAADAVEGPDSRFGVLVDIPNCIGCRKCEFACQEAAGFSPPPIETFDDKSVFSTHRRPDSRLYTTVNEFRNPKDPTRPLYVKANCVHCHEPACASACLVGALKKDSRGAVVYDASKCMGCRYCMVACPFQIPTYEYDNALTPQVRKCTFCFDRISKEGGVPACVKICPRECLTFGKRTELLAMAQEKVRDHPDSYVDHIYGEHEAGGTSWMYLSGVPFERLGFIPVGDAPLPQLTEAIQHGVFKFFVPPLALYGLLAIIARLTRADDSVAPAPLRHPNTARESIAGDGRAAGAAVRAGRLAATDSGVRP
jgi:formate dehydrogenase iron-sulfur subunit